MRPPRAIAAALLAATLSAQAPAPAAPRAAPAAALAMWRLDCGSVAANDLDRFSDSFAYVGRSKRLVASCYLIRHGDTYMLWDTGLPAAMKGKPIDATKPMDATVTVTIAEQLARLGVDPARVGIVAVSHYHSDHLGQAAAFPKATLMIGRGDLDAVRARAPGTDAAPLAPWIEGGAKVDPVDGDRDVFGDGRVVMLAMPGHTPGHHALLVRLASGPVLLTGDTAHFHANYDGDGVPSFNVDRADTLASFARFKAIARNLKARVVIQHDPDDVALLPAFPEAAR